MKKIVFVNQSSGYLMTDIVNAYAEKYSEVALIYGSIKKNERFLNPAVKLDKICAYNRGSSVKRLLSWVWGSLQIFFKLLFKYKGYHVVYVTNPPMGYLSSLILKNPFSVIVFDTYPDALANIGIRKGNFIFNQWSKWNNKLFTKAEKVFTLSDGMTNRLANYIEREKITVVPCWSANSRFAPIEKYENSFVKNYKLEEKFTVMYSGNMGLTHNVQLLVECAKRLKNNTAIHFMLIGGGKKKPELEAMVKENGLTNCTIMDWLPADQLPYSLAAADLGAISLNDDTALVSVPSKTFNLLAVGSPLLCIASKESEIAHMVAKYDNGQCFDTNEVVAMVEYIVKLSQDNELKVKLSQNSLTAARNFTFYNAKQYLL